jgi:hypothetical protein
MTRAILVVQLERPVNVRAFSGQVRRFLSEQEVRSQ